MVKILHPVEKISKISQHFGYFVVIVFQCPHANAFQGISQKMRINLSLEGIELRSPALGFSQIGFLNIQIQGFTHSVEGLA